MGCTRGINGWLKNVEESVWWTDERVGSEDGSAGKSCGEVGEDRGQGCRYVYDDYIFQVNKEK